MQQISQPCRVVFPLTDKKIDYYLQKKKLNQDLGIDIPEISFNLHAPWDILCSNDEARYFFSPYKLKYPEKPENSSVDRKTKGGYWKRDGSIRKVTTQTTKGVFVFHTGVPNKNSKRTGYVLHVWEHNDMKDLVFCRLHYKDKDKSSCHQGDSSTNMSLSSGEGYPQQEANQEVFHPPAFDSFQSTAACMNFPNPNCLDYPTEDAPSNWQDCDSYGNNNYSTDDSGSLFSSLWQTIGY